MWGTRKLCFCLIWLLPAADSLRFVEKKFQKPYLQVQTKTGTLQGIRVKYTAEQNGYYFAYLGIPYAQPPLGSLRFRAPKWPQNWSGVLDGSREASGCVEIRIRTRNPSEVVGTEDCLFLNVFTGKNPKKTKQLKPVVVFFHGGAFLEGKPDATDYGPELLVSKDIVFVSLNYRIGIFGFLNTEDLASPGNYGLKDQNMVLRWVQINIRNFGGDPNSVTIFGQSAGSVSVNFHLLSPKSKGLFHRAILDSGSVLCHWGSQRKPRNIAYLVGVANGITEPKNSEDLVERLRKIDLQQLKDSQIGVTLAGIGMATVLGLPYAPSIEPDHEDAFISKDFWYEMLKHGEFNRVPVLMGVNANESLFFIRVIQTIRPVLVAYDVDPSFATPPAMNISDNPTSVEVGRIVTKHYLGPEGTFSKAHDQTIVKFTSDDYFIRPIWKTAILMAKYVPLYFYYFSYEGVLGSKGIHKEAHHPEFKGVAHTEELYYLFNKLNKVSERRTDYFIRKQMVALWTNFIKYSNPTPQKAELLKNIVWPKFSSLDESQMKYLEINETLTIRQTLNEQVYFDWWETLFKKYSKPPLRTY